MLDSDCKKRTVSIERRITMNIVKKNVFHKKYGTGIITAFDAGNLTVEFSERTARFKFPDAFIQGFLTTTDKALIDFTEKVISEKADEKKARIKEERQNAIVFCNISWMDNYLGETESDIPKNGGEYVRIHKMCNESLNFLPISVCYDDENTERIKLLGSYETKSTNGITINQTHIEKINGCKSLIYNEQATGITVVWCATAPEGGSCVVGWYKDATVFRHYQQMPITADDGSEWERWYNVSCDYENAVLLPVNERKRSEWYIPRSSNVNSKGFGFGQSNIWYAEGESARRFADNIMNNIESYCGKNNMMKLL